MSNKYKWLNKHSRLFLERGYLKEGVTPEARVRRVMEIAEKYCGIDGFADETEEFMAMGDYTFSTPIWTNFGEDRGLPVSCFGSYIDDTMESILEKNSEVGMMSKFGGGTSGYFGSLRPRGSPIKDSGSSGGPNQFLELLDGSASKGLREFILDGGSISHIYELFDNVADTVSQGSSRRGSFAAYLPVEHPDVEEFLLIRSEGHAIQNMSIGITITDEWMESMIAGDKPKRKIWGLIIKKRFETGYPYIVFIDTVNKNAPSVYKEKYMKILASNLCSEICLSSDEFNSFVCVLMSLNLANWDRIKANPRIIRNAVILLDCVCEEFVRKTANIPLMKPAHDFARKQRALGLGALGWHSLLQSKMVPFESMEAKLLNNEIWKFIRQHADLASEELAARLGEPELMAGTGRRNVTTLAIAPTTSSSFILGQISPSIEPENSCYYVKKLAKGSFTYRNPYLEKLLKEKGKDEDDTWKSILVHGGSVQHLDFLDRNEKDVFKTFGEISQKEIIIQAAQRQKYIDQAQSLNLMIPSTTKAKDVSDLMIEAWKLGVKTLYYQRSSNPSQQLARSILACSSCEA